MKDNKSHKLCIAPMMDHTDRHFRFFMRLLSKHAFLYTEMVTTDTLIHGDRERFLRFQSIEHPVAFQLGGSQPDDLVKCCHFVEDAGYDEVNLNIGCPSDRVQNGQFGACLMSNPELVAECVHNMQKHVAIPVTVKTRIGIDDRDDFDFLFNFIDKVASAGCQSFIVHARIAILSGLSPKENREIPILNYARVYEIKNAFPHLNIIINGGFKETDSVIEQMQHVDGVMIGRAAYQNPYWIAELDHKMFQERYKLPNRKEIFRRYQEYMLEQSTQGIRLSNMSRHIIGLFQGQPGARKFRQYLSTGHPEIQKPPPELLEAAINSVSSVS